MNSTPFTSTPRRIAVPAAMTVSVLLALASPALAGRKSQPAPAAAPTAVRVERTRPQRENLPTLRFLKTNRDFFRSRLDQIRERPIAGKGGAQPIDPRFLSYRSMVEAALAATDSVGSASFEREHMRLLGSVGEFTRLEGELDQMDRLLAAQRTRLGVLQADFAGRQRTALAIVVSGWPEGAALDSITVRFDDGTSHTVAITADERSSLAHGGVLELSHGLVEPREQVLEFSLAGSGFAAGVPGFVTLSPTQDRLTFLRLDLASVRPATGAPAMNASTWVHDDLLSADGGSDPTP